MACMKSPAGPASSVYPLRHERRGSMGFHAKDDNNSRLVHSGGRRIRSMTFSRKRSNQASAISASMDSLLGGRTRAEA